MLLLFSLLSCVQSTHWDPIDCSTPGSVSPLSPGVCSNSCPWSWWCHPTNSFSVTPFSSCPQSFPASGSFLMSWLLAPGDQSIRAWVSASVSAMNIQGCFPLGLTGLISLLSKGFPRVFSSTRIQKNQFFGAQPSLWSCLQSFPASGSFSRVSSLHQVARVLEL